MMALREKRSAKLMHFRIEHAPNHHSIVLKLLSCQFGWYILPELYLGNIGLNAMEQRNYDILKSN